MFALHRVIRTLTLCSPLALAACASGPSNAPVTAASRPVVSSTDDGLYGGIYKIGKPYQVEGVWYYPAEDYAYVQEGVASWYGADFHGKSTANGEKYDMNALTAAHTTLPMPSVVKVTNLENGRVLKLTVNDRGPFHSSRIIDVSRRAAQLLGFYEQGITRVRVEIDAEESLNLKNIALSKRPPEMPRVAAAPRAGVSSIDVQPIGGTVSNSVREVAVAPPVQTAAVNPVQPAKAAPPSTASGIYIQAGAFSEEANARRLEQQLGEFGTVHVMPTTVNNKRLYRVRLGPLADDSVATALLGRIKGFGYKEAKVVRQ
jgi:rare lipoprotein A